MKLNLYDALQQPNKIIKSLKDADIATLTLVLSYITSDLSYIDRIKPYVKGAFDYAVKVPEDLSQEIRNGDLTIKEGANLIKKFDGEYPERFEKEIFKYLSVSEKEFGKKINDLFESPTVDKEYLFELSDSFRSPHLWKKTNKGFEIRHKIEDYFPEYFKK